MVPRESEPWIDLGSGERTETRSRVNVPRRSDTGTQGDGDPNGTEEEEGG